MRFVITLCLAVGFITTSFNPAVRAADEWKTVDPAQLALKTPVVEKDAEAEALLWEMRVEKSEEKATISHYVRIKIFTDRGRESQSTVELPYYKDLKIKDIAGRTIHADGKIIPLEPSAIFDKMVIKARKFKVNVFTFVLPAVEAGSIIEYRWREEQKDAYFLTLDLQREVPVQALTVSFKGKASDWTSQQLRFFHAPEAFFKDDGKGWRTSTMTNIHAFQPEPNMPPENAVKAWMIAFTKYAFASNTEVWNYFGKSVYERTKGRLKVTDEVKKAATEATIGATTDEQKLAKIFAFCRANIRQVNDPAANISEAEKSNFKENKSSSDTLRQKLGTGQDINLLFGAMANALGYEARLAMLADRSRTAFSPDFPVPDYELAYMTSSHIAVRTNNTWRSFDPASAEVSYGMLRWQEENQDALVSDPVRSFFTVTPLSGPDKSRAKRTANLRLSEEGVLEGDVRVEFSGHLSADRKLFYSLLEANKRSEKFTEIVAKGLSNAKLTEVKLENIDEPHKPFAYSYHLRVENYAQRTSKRLVLKPAYFQSGDPALFTASTRKHPITFDYPWSEEDEVKIELPPGFELDHAEGVEGVRSQPVAEYHVSIAVTEDGRTLIYKRNFFFGGGGYVAFAAEKYAAIKQLFELVQQRDNHQIMLKQGVVASK